MRVIDWTVRDEHFCYYETDNKIRADGSVDGSAAITWYVTTGSALPTSKLCLKMQADRYINKYMTAVAHKLALRRLAHVHRWLCRQL